MLRRLTRLWLVVTLAVLPTMGGCAVGGGAGGSYFTSPEEGVGQIKAMLLQEDWPRLAGYYDLSGTEIDRSTLTAGMFFIETERPDVAHPAGFWRFKHPFPPSFDYVEEEATDDPTVSLVRVGIEIEQGEGSPPQRGFMEFLMKQSDRGWQVLPGRPGM